MHLDLRICGRIVGVYVILYCLSVALRTFQVGRYDSRRLLWHLMLIKIKYLDILRRIEKRWTRRRLSCNKFDDTIAAISQISPVLFGNWATLHISRYADTRTLSEHVLSLWTSSTNHFRSSVFIHSTLCIRVHENLFKLEIENK